MASYVYLIQNGDLFNIGITNNLERTRIDLRPGELVAFLITEKPEPLIKNLRKIYIDNRLPGSDYYRLANSQVKECRSFLEGDGSKNYFQPFLKGPSLMIFFLFAWFIVTYIIIELAVNPVLNRFS
ncbi:GIY-YIG nuclease family protein [Prochlorococcus marinus]|uniref:GIY-YIG nuclease family protein n=1 Tax=Prochlorococcus marinus TaxID=1219 RepID=UPI0022B46F09|nr:GIY-YIG nuclease family protein [Prochlorococcus marinus]